MRRWISCVRPPIVPRAARAGCGSGRRGAACEYSAVTQPRPLPRSKPGSRSSTLTAQSTRSRPRVSEDRALGEGEVPGLDGERGRSWSGARPSVRRPVAAEWLVVMWLPILRQPDARPRDSVEGVAQEDGGAPAADPMAGAISAVSTAGGDAGGIGAVDAGLVRAVLVVAEVVTAGGRELQGGGQRGGHAHPGARSGSGSSAGCRSLAPGPAAARRLMPPSKRLASSSV